MNAPYAPVGNRILQALPAMERNTLLAQLRPTTLSAKTVIFEPGEAIDSVHFPLEGVISMVTPLADGIVEVASIGNEGIVGVPLTHAGVGCVRAVSPLGAQTLQMRAATFLAEIERLDTFRRLVERYLLALFAQISQAAACNRLQQVRHRLRARGTRNHALVLVQPVRPVQAVPVENAVQRVEERGVVDARVPAIPRRQVVVGGVENPQ